MNKKCARPECGKTVYQLEELKCLDKVWHKLCFKCSVCGMALNMKNYKGYNKMPYCEAHYPKTVATVVADTPESRRIAENTKIQSQAHYHADFERMKGKKTDVVDDPETTRHLSNMRVVSQAAYHHEMERKLDMEKTRPPMEMVGGVDNANGFSPYSARQQQATLIYSTEQGGPVPVGQRPVGSIADYDPVHGRGSSAATQLQQAQQHQHHQQQQQHQMRSPLALNTSNLQPQQHNYQGQQQQPPLSPQQAARYPSGAPRGGAPPMHPQQQQQQQQQHLPTFQAIYDYTAADTDEVTFVEGDLIVDCQPVDEGWMVGTIRRTGLRGMLPANYVERVK